MKLNPGGKVYSWKIDLADDSYSYIKDHGFQGMDVLPGSFYVHMALTAGQSIFNDVKLIIKSIDFKQIFLLSTDHSQVIYIDVVKNNSNELLFTCYSLSTNSVNNNSKIIHAEGIILRNNVNDFETIATTEKKAAFKCALSGDDFYKQLNSAGNYFGPDFQGVRQIWYENLEALSRINLPETVKPGPDEYLVHPVLLDACTQVMSVLKSSANNHRTFVLTGIEKIAFNIPPEINCWSYVLLSKEQQNEDALTGNIKILNDSGEVSIEITKARFHFINYTPSPELKEVVPSASIAIAATFTADLLEKPLNFWKRQLQIPFKIEFAPYNQVFQQLFDPTSLLSLNRGLNVLLLRFEDWLNDDYGLAAKMSRKEKADLLQGKASYTLPNHLEIAHLNQYETEYVFKEIFVDQCYLKHGITINDGDCIIDIGANIGLFTLFALHHCHDPEIYAFEPSPPVYDLLNVNAGLYGTKVKTFNCGVSDKTKQAAFTFYEKSSVFSSFNADAEEDKAAIRSVINNMLKENVDADGLEVNGFVEEVLEGRLESQQFICPLKSLSDIIKENGILRIDLLKIDAEKSELDILKGIEEKDWEKIKQIVIEIHDNSGSVLKEIKQILDKKGFTFHIEEERLLQDSGLFNVFATRPGQKEEVQNFSGRAKDKIEENLNQLITAIQSAAMRSATPYLICPCPPSPTGKVNRELHKKMEEFIKSAFENKGNVHVLTSLDIDKKYPVRNFYDREGEKIGHVPYTHEFFNALGTSIIRKFKMLNSNPYKVIILDCDQTLWKGVCGEDGALGIQIGDEHQYLQNFMIDKLNAGMLLCLCSKNNEGAVNEVFEKNQNMILKKEHIILKKINWNSKSENIKAIAEELQLGLDSFIFIDDNPVEIAEIQANCPEVLTLQLPAEQKEIPKFLDHVWDLDLLKATEEDKKRTLLYQQNVHRENFRKTALTLKDFLDGLHLDIRIFKPEHQHLKRISQLTHRTNQFNFSTKRRKETQLRHLIDTNALICRIVAVKDRFGDYGVVGVMLFKFEEERLIIDTFLLSCRVLGKGVEHKMMAHLAEIAAQHGVQRVQTEFVPSEKNNPALKFLNAMGGQMKSGTREGYLYEFALDTIKNLTYQPASSNDSITGGQTDQLNDTLKDNKYTNGHSELAMRIASSLNNVEKIQKLINALDHKERPVISKSYVAPTGDFEESMAQIWRQVLGLADVGMNDNFFEIGGTSLKGVQVVALLKKKLNRDISIVNLFESPTISAMAKALEDKSKSSSGNITAVQSRGAIRRSLRGLRNRSKNK